MARFTALIAVILEFDLLSQKKRRPMLSDQTITDVYDQMLGNK